MLALTFDLHVHLNLIFIPVLIESSTLPMLSNRAQQPQSDADVPGIPTKNTTHSPTMPGPPLKDISGLPQQKENNFPYYRDIHMDTAKGLTGAMGSFADIRMGTAKGITVNDDIRMETARGATTLKQGGFQMWERELLESSEVKRKATVAQLCESIFYSSLGQTLALGFIYIARSLLTIASLTRPMVLTSSIRFS